MVYENNWESLNKRPVPKWFSDAKFGIFIHWGLYSVPAYSRKTEYAEWYREQLNKPEHPSRLFHDRVYGPGFKYEDFVHDFRAELFDANKWAKLFSQSGARYINFVSKHHDGFCMYKSDYAWNWNSVDVGPKRDFCAELAEALAATEVRFGVYHSLYEWYNPLYLKDPIEYSKKRLLPMLKELVERYKPATLFTDGEWEHESSVWQSTDFLTWLYNESSVKDFIVPNDRWGKETRGRLGGNFTSEYGTIDGKLTLDDIEDDRPFEECRGIGHSFGFNRAEGAQDYLSSKELIELLCSLVSKGGNLLLNIGPAADGTIPAIMEERLLDIGSWLVVNGEAIYESRKYCPNSEEGVYYTTRNGNIYAIINRFPFGEITLKDIEYKPGMRASLLGSDAHIGVRDDGGKACLFFAPINPDELASKHLYTFKLYT